MSALLSATLTSPSAHDKSLTLPMTSPRLLDILFSAVNKTTSRLLPSLLRAPLCACAVCQLARPFPPGTGHIRTRGATAAEVLITLTRPLTAEGARYTILAASEFFVAILQIYPVRLRCELCVATREIYYIEGVTACITVTVMEEFVSLVVFFLLVSCPATMQQQPNDACKDFSSDYFQFYFYFYYEEESPYFTSRYADLYQKFEESLISNSKLLGKLRTGFISKEDIPIYFRLKLELMNGTDIKCKDYSDKYTTATFCPNTSSPGSPWILCHNTLDMTFSSQTLSSLQAEEKRQSIDYSIQWLSFLHGSLPTMFMMFDVPDYDHASYTSDVSLTLRIDKLDCNPSLNLTKCVVSELLSWVSWKVIIKSHNILIL